MEWYTESRPPTSAGAVSLFSPIRHRSRTVGVQWSLRSPTWTPVASSPVLRRCPGAPFGTAARSRSALGPEILGSIGRYPRRPRHAGPWPSGEGSPDPSRPARRRAHVRLAPRAQLGVCLRRSRLDRCERSSLRRYGRGPFVPCPQNDRREHELRRDPPSHDGSHPARAGVSLRLGRARRAILQLPRYPRGSERTSRRRPWGRGGGDAAVVLLRRGLGGRLSSQLLGLRLRFLVVPADVRDGPLHVRSPVRILR